MNAGAEDVNLIAEAVADRLQRGQLAITQAAQDELRQFGPFMCPPMAVGNYYMLYAVINRDGSLSLELKDHEGAQVWRGELRA